MAEDQEKQEIAYNEGKVSKEQLAEIEAGDFVTVKEVATKTRYSTAWISYNLKHGLIKGIKPLGRQWRIPKSEYQRMITEGSMPPMPRQALKPPITDIPVAMQEQAKVQEVAAKEKQPWKFPLHFTFLD